MDKRGQGLSTSAIILIILGIFILVILAFGFILGWDKIAPWLKPENNVDAVVRACQISCSMQSTYDFCQKIMRLKAPNLPEEQAKKDGYKDATCSFFATDPNYKKYGIDACPSIAC